MTEQNMSPEVALALKKLTEVSLAKIEALARFDTRMKELLGGGRIHMHPSTVTRNNTPCLIEVPVPNDAGAYAELQAIQQEIVKIETQMEFIFSSTTGVSKITLLSLQEEMHQKVA